MFIIKIYTNLSGKLENNDCETPVLNCSFSSRRSRLRAKTEVMEEISSQNSDLGLEDLDKLEAKGQAENTKRATSWGIKKFEKWCDKRKLKVDFN